jgi:hypothetical protein
VNRIYLLSPANPSGIRARQVMNEAAKFDLAVRLRSEGAALGDVFAFISGLYFRGKITYASAYGTPLIITAGRGLLPPETRITLDDLRAIAAVPIDLEEPLYRKALERDALQLHKTLPEDCEVVLLGSIATSKYLEPLIDILGSRLMFPADFVGLGDMSRGGLMLRCVREGRQLDYIRATYEPKKRPKRL